jgi:hypothetical protein
MKLNQAGNIRNRLPVPLACVSLTDRSTLPFFSYKFQFISQEIHWATSHDFKKKSLVFLLPETQQLIKMKLQKSVNA